MANTNPHPSFIYRGVDIAVLQRRLDEFRREACEAHEDLRATRGLSPEWYDQRARVHRIEALINDQKALIARARAVQR